MVAIGKLFTVDLGCSAPPRGFGNAFTQKSFALREKNIANRFAVVKRLSGRLDSHSLALGLVGFPPTCPMVGW